MKALVVCTHGYAAKELVFSAEMICGKQENIATVSFEEGETPEKLKTKLLAQLDQLDTTAGILFLTDLKGGTPFNVLVSLVPTLKQAEILTGVNIPMLLEAFLNRNQLSLQELTAQILESGKAAIYRYEEIQVEAIEEDF